MEQMFFDVSEAYCLKRGWHDREVSELGCINSTYVPYATVCSSYTYGKGVAHGVTPTSGVWVSSQNNY